MAVALCLPQRLPRRRLGPLETNDLQMTVTLLYLSHKEIDVVTPSFLGPGADWLFNPIIANFLPRVKVKIEGTKMDHYLNGDYENKRGRIPAVTKVTSEFEQTVLVYFDSGDSRTIQARYVVPLPPTYMGEEVLVIHGPQKGNAMIVREQPDDDTITVSSKANPAAVVGIPKSHVLALYEDTGR